jgi:anti-sigma-K factor RskA
MSGHDRHERWGDDLAAYALGALEPAEATALEHHLDSCERCRAELRWLAPAVRSLADSVERQQPPPSLRTSLMAAVREDARRAEGETAAQRNWWPAWLRGGSGPRRLRLAAGVATVALAVAAVAGYEVGKDGSGEVGNATTLSTRQPNGITVKMVREGDGGTLRLAGVRQLPPGKVLEAWVRREGTVEAVPALFVPDRSGRASTTIADLSGVEAVMVTQEPRGGSTAPTSKPIVTMSVPQ